MFILSLLPLQLIILVTLAMWLTVKLVHPATLISVQLVSPTISLAVITALAPIAQLVI